MKQPSPVRNVFFVLAGVAGLLLKPHYQGPHGELVHSYLGNVAVSFAIYFLFLRAAARLGAGRLVAAASALAVVEAFEAADGFGIMTNVYDPLDFLANAAGIGIAFVTDLAVSRPTS
jgi:hypothetical protein